MQKIAFVDGQKISSAKVTIDEVDYPVTPARYSGATPLSSTVLNTMQNNIENAINQNVDNIGGEEYDETATYEVGDIVKYEGQLYICTTAVETPEDFDDTKWTETDVLSSAGGNEIAIGSASDITGKTKIFVDESTQTLQYKDTTTGQFTNIAGDEVFIGDIEDAPEDAKIIIDDDGVETYGLEVSISPTEPTSKTGVWLQHGKNLFNKNSFNWVYGFVSVSQTKLVITGDNDKTLYIPIKPNTQYTVSKISTTPFILGTCTNIINNASMPNAVNGTTETSKTITSGASDHYLCLTYYNNTSTETEQNILNSIQIQLGSTATTYEAYIQDKEYILDNGNYEEFVNIESGSNANGSYTKFPDGTLICTCSSLTGSMDSTSKVYIAGWTFPYPFIDTNYVITGNVLAGNSKAYTVAFTNGTATSIIQHTKCLGTNGAVTDCDRGAPCMAIGRWK